MTGQKTPYDEQTVLIYTLYIIYFYSKPISVVLFAHPGPDQPVIGTRKPPSKNTDIEQLFSRYNQPFWHSSRFSQTFVWRRTNHRMKRVRPVCPEGKGGWIGRIFPSVIYRSYNRRDPEKISKSYRQRSPPYGLLILESSLPHITTLTRVSNNLNFKGIENPCHRLSVFLLDQYNHYIKEHDRSWNIF